MDGVHLFANGKLAHSRTGDLSLTVCRDGAMPLEQWREYLEQMHALTKQTKREVTVGLFWFVENPPDAAMRKEGSDFVANNNVVAMRRVALVTDSVAGRAALTAMSWFMKRSSFKPFAPKKLEDALSWLREDAEFDMKEAATLFEGLRRAVGVPAVGIEPTRP